MPSKNEGIASRTRSQAPKPVVPPPASNIGKHTKNIGSSNVKKITRSDSEKSALKRIKEGRAFNAESSLSVDGTGVCRINTGKMMDRSQQEVYNYAYLVNRYIASQRGRKVKIKSTKEQHDAQQLFCGTVRKKNEDLFDTLNQGKAAKDKTFSVVGHVPDECIQVRSFGQSHNQLASANVDGIGAAPGWMPMTRQANSLVAKIGNQTLNSTGQQNGPFLTKIEVDGQTPVCLLPIKAVTDALGRNPYPSEDDESDGESGGESGDESNGKSEEE